MPYELKIPEVGESVQEVQIGQWLIKEGEWIEKDEPVVEIDTDKASLEIYAPVSGIVRDIAKKEGEAAEIGEVVGTMEEADKPSGEEPSSGSKEKAKKGEKKEKGKKEGKQKAKKDEEAEEATSKGGADGSRVMPAARRLLQEHDLSAEEVPASGPGDRLTKEDVVKYLESGEKEADEESETDGEKRAATKEQKEEAPGKKADRGPEAGEHRQSERVRMSLIRRRIAARLVEAQQQAALLTTVNEIDMTEVLQLRKKYRDAFQEKYEIKLGFMSFFVKAVIDGLKEFPAVNARVDGEEIIYHNYYDIGIAIGGGKGLVVPVLRNAERMSFAEVEKTIDDLARRAQNNKITPDELEGGTFTITNGGIYGSLLSSPIVNPPQSGVLGMHAIQERPVARNGEIVIRPMMYVALTYDHRIVDGREAVTFLRRVKETLEDPSRMLLEV